MQLDKTRITIRERDYVDILDLALRIVRAGGWPLAIALVLGAAPMMALNAWLLSGLGAGLGATGFASAQTGDTAGLPNSAISIRSQKHCWTSRQWHPSAADETHAEVEYVYTEPDFDEPDWQTRYVMLTLLLVFWQIPLASAPATLYLGQRLFSTRTRPGTLVRRFFESLPQMVLYQGLLRPLYVFRPYLSEVILLERNPMFRRDQELRTDPGHAIASHRAAWEGPGHAPIGGHSTLRRSRGLHRGASGDLMARLFGAAAVGGLLAFATWGSAALVRMLFVSQTQWNDVLITLYFPLALWVVVSFFSVVRFLAYLDLRIRREGWEVELLARAERARLVRKWRVGNDIT